MTLSDSRCRSSLPVQNEWPGGKRQHRGTTGSMAPTVNHTDGCRRPTRHAHRTPPPQTHTYTREQTCSSGLCTSNQVHIAVLFSLHLLSCAAQDLHSAATSLGVSIKNWIQDKTTAFQQLPLSRQGFIANTGFCWLQGSSTAVSHRV